MRTKELTKMNNKPDILAIKNLIVNNGTTDNRLLIASVMRASGCTYQNIADVFGYTRQNAESLLKRASNEVRI